MGDPLTRSLVATRRGYYSTITEIVYLNLAGVVFLQNIHWVCGIIILRVAALALRPWQPVGISDVAHLQFSHLPPLLIMARSKIILAPIYRYFVCPALRASCVVTALL